MKEETQREHDPIETLALLTPRYWARGRLRKQGNRYCALGWLMHKAGLEPDVEQAVATTDQVAALTLFYKTPRTFFSGLIGLNDTGLSLNDVKRRAAYDFEALK